MRSTDKRWVLCDPIFIKITYNGVGDVTGKNWAPVCVSEGQTPQSLGTPTQVWIKQ